MPARWGDPRADCYQRSTARGPRTGSRDASARNAHLVVHPPRWWRWDVGGEGHHPGAGVEAGQRGEDPSERLLRRTAGRVPAANRHTLGDVDRAPLECCGGPGQATAVPRTADRVGRVLEAGPCGVKSPAARGAEPRPTWSSGHDREWLSGSPAKAGPTPSSCTRTRRRLSRRGVGRRIGASGLQVVAAEVGEAGRAAAASRYGSRRHRGGRSRPRTRPL